MAQLKEIAQVAYDQLYPQSSDETPVKVEHFIEKIKILYATQIWIFARNEKNAEGVFNVPSYLLSPAEITVENNQADISNLNILKSLPSEVWLQNVGGFDCTYIKSTVNASQLLNDDEALSSFKTYYVIGDKINFPRGTHKKNLSIIYANSGDTLTGDVYIDDAMAGILIDKLVESYGGKTAKEDTTNNSSSVI